MQSTRVRVVCWRVESAPLASTCVCVCVRASVFMCVQACVRMSCVASWLCVRARAFAPGLDALRSRMQRAEREQRAERAQQHHRHEPHQPELRLPRDTR